MKIKNSHSRSGLGTPRPASKAVPKEMLPIVDKPAIQYIVEEAVASGIEDILIITSRGMTTLEDHFDRSPELESRRWPLGKTDLYNQVVDIANLCNINTCARRRPRAWAAVYCARSFVGDEPFAVPSWGRCDYPQGEACHPGAAATHLRSSAWGRWESNRCLLELIHKYCSLDATQLREGIFQVRDMIEKPKPEEVITNYAILGAMRCPPSFGAGEYQARRRREIQLTDAMRVLAQREG